MENLDKLIKELCKLPNETQWLEFKHNNYNMRYLPYWAQLTCC